MYVQADLALHSPLNKCNVVNDRTRSQFVDMKGCPRWRFVFSSTGRRPASYCHGVVTSCVRPSVRPFVRACVRKLFL